jgi:hypothetical protein
MYQNQGGMNRLGSYDACEQPCDVQREDYVSALDRAKGGAEEVSRALYSLIAAITGPRPEASGDNKNQISAKRSLKDALDAVPGEIGESCHVSLKRIEEIRQLLRV